jgi:hypothetical protein
MTSSELENLVRLGYLKREVCSQREFDSLVKSRTARLGNASNSAVSIEGGWIWPTMLRMRSLARRSAITVIGPRTVTWSSRP